MSDSDMTNSCSSCGSSSSCGGSDCSTCGGCSTDANQHSTITLTMEDDTEVECAILTIFPVDAKEYIALLPLDEEGQNHDFASCASTESLHGDTTAPLENFGGSPTSSFPPRSTPDNKAAIAFDTVLQNAREAEAAGTPLE